MNRILKVIPPYWQNILAKTGHQVICATNSGNIQTGRVVADDGEDVTIKLVSGRTVTKKRNKVWVIST